MRRHNPHRGDEAKAAFEFLMECGAKYNAKFSVKTVNTDADVEVA
jgi:hypothetical protein